VEEEKKWTNNIDRQAAVNPELEWEQMTPWEKICKGNEELE